MTNFYYVGAMETWPAMRDSRWNFQSFIDTYGNHTIRAASAFEAAHRLFPNTQETITFKQALIPGNDKYDLYIHDNAFLKTVPELGRDFRVPKPFRFDSVT